MQMSVFQPFWLFDATSNKKEKRRLRRCRSHFLFCCRIVIAGCNVYSIPRSDLLFLFFAIKTHRGRDREIGKQTGLLLREDEKKNINQLLLKGKENSTLLKRTRTEQIAEEGISSVDGPSLPLSRYYYSITLIIQVPIKRRS